MRSVKHRFFLPVLLAGFIFHAGAGRLNAQSYPGGGTDPTYSQQGDDQQNTNGAQDLSNQLQQSRRSYPQATTPQGANLENNDDQSRPRADGQATQDRESQILNQLPPDPPTDFQQMVANSIGKMLPIYGARLFRRAPSTFAPVDRAPVTPNYVLGPGDELLLRVWGQVTLNSRVTVDRAGEIYIPQVGSVHVAGLAFGQLQDFLKAQMGRVFRNFDLNVSMGELRSIQVFVVGQARRPGTYTVSSLSTLVNALFVTGGPTPQGSMRHIQLKRAGKVIVDFDLYDLLLHGDKSADVPLLPGDVIYIPPVGPQVAAAGSVNNAAIYELKDGLSNVGDLLDLAGGASNVAAQTNAHLERVDAHSTRSVIDIDLRAAGRNQPLRDGDILELVSIVAQLKDGVTLRGNVANPGHYGWRAGMRVGDLFPDKDALITRDYWLKRGQLGQPVLNYLPYCPPTPYSYSDPNNRNGSNPLYNSPGTTQNNGAALNQGQQSSAIDRSSQIDYSQGCVPSPYDRRFNADGTQRYPQSASNPNTRDDRDPRNSNDYEDQRDAPRDNAESTRESAAAALVGRGPGHFEPRNDVALSAPDINWSYAVIERQDKTTLTTSLIPFNLGKLVLDKDTSQNPELEPGDVVTIFSKADIQVPQAEQTRLVHLEGEFVSSGVYSVRPGETLRELIARAGGFTADAYLYGSQFTRESTRRVQQQRLNEYVDEIALQSATRSVNSATGSLSALSSSAAAASAAQSQTLINNLRQARASGRIVLDLRPDSNTVAQIAQIPLEDGDRFIVPHVPVTVSVAGAVYNPNSFLFDPHIRLRDYLRDAGGPNRDGDRKRAYVIRADGSVVSKQAENSWARNNFDTLRIYPGDTIVVPLNLNKGAALRNFVDIAQIFGQFGIAAAASSVVF